MTTDISEGNHIKKDCENDYYEVKTETRYFEINIKDLKNDGSFPRSRLLAHASKKAKSKAFGIRRLWKEEVV